MAMKVYPPMNLVYCVFTEEVLPNDTETANLMDFYGARSERAGNLSVCEAALFLLADRALHMDTLVTRTMAQTALPRGTVALALRHLIWHGTLEINWKQLFYLTTTWTGKRVSKTALVWRKDTPNV